MINICEIQTGYTARERLEPAQADGLMAIQLRDVPADGGLAPDTLTRYELGDIPERYIARAGDVLFRSRGERNTAVAIDENWSGKAVVVLPLILLRPNRQHVVPQYLAWILNQPAAQRHFDKAARGTAMRMIPRSSFTDLIIDLPPLEEQKKIVAVDVLSQRELELSKLSATKRRTLTTAVLIQQAQAAGTQQHIEGKTE